jgi:hypothetical protein
LKLSNVFITPEDDAMARLPVEIVLEAHEEGAELNQWLRQRTTAAGLRL